MWVILLQQQWVLNWKFQFKFAATNYTISTQTSVKYFNLICSSSLISDMHYAMSQDRHITHTKRRRKKSSLHMWEWVISSLIPTCSWEENNFFFVSMIAHSYNMIDAKYLIITFCTEVILILFFCLDF